MKFKITFLSILLVPVAFTALAQQVEYDDMYFRSKDRVVLAASKPLTVRMPAKEMEVISTINPTDSYSARNVNPEYLSQSKVNPSSPNEPVSYFVPNYTPTSVNQNICSCSTSSSYSNPNYYGNAGYNPYYGGMSGFGNPYSSFYSPYGYGNPYGYNSFYGSGWSTSLSMTMGFGAYNPWGSSYYGMNSWGMGMGYGSGYYGYGYNSGWYRPPVVVIGGADTNGSGVVYGKRSSRSNDINNNVTTSNRSTAIIDSQGRSRGSSGRIAGSESNTSGNYYQRGWRTNPETNPTRTSWSSLGRTINDGSSTLNNGRSNSSSLFNDSGSRSSSWTGGNSSFSGGGGSRSSGGSIGGGSTSGATRGRH
jgi:hypothetical protein